jgi:hypothetical protein
MMVVEL